MSAVDTLDESAPRRTTDGRDVRGPALVVLWAADPNRLGERVLLGGGEPHVFGRGEASSDDPHPRALLARQRPGVTSPCPALDLPSVSRNQLRLTIERDAIRIDNLGKRALLDGAGEVITSTLVRAGDCVELRGQLVLGCVERPRELPRSRAAALTDFAFGAPDARGLVGESLAAWTLRDECAFVADRAAHVLVLGESGTGKELVAQAIHALSKRQGRPLVARNAATIPVGLADAELFGNLANYPNPGMPERKGLVGEADGTTLFLDEIGELPESIQARLLRVLDDGREYQRLGEGRVRRADIRLIAATNRPVSSLKHDVAARFKLRLTTPGLDQRREDLPLLARHLLRRIANGDPELRARFFTENPDGTAEPRVSPALARALFRGRYRTHLRELDARLWSAIASSEADVLDVGALDDDALESAATPAEVRLPGDVTEDEVRAALARAGGVQEQAWRDLGLASRYVLKRLIAKYGITRP